MMTGYYGRITMTVPTDGVPRQGDALVAPGVPREPLERDRAISCARAILRGNYDPQSGPVVVAAYLLRTLGLSP